LGYWHYGVINENANENIFTAVAKIIIIIITCGVLNLVTCVGPINNREFFGDLVLGFFVHTVGVS
jgi:hypothetical protein